MIDNVIKKISLVTASLLLVTTSATADIFVGADYLMGDGMTYDYTTDSYGDSSLDTDIDGFKLKVGFGTPSSVTFDIYYAMLEDEYEGEINEFGFNVRPYFDITNDFKFYIQGGLGYGGISDVYDGEDLNYFQGQIGLGVSYVFEEQFELCLGYDYKAQVWEDIEFYDSYNTETVSTTATGGGLYFGANFYFGGAGSASSYSKPTSAPTPNNAEYPREQERVY